MTIAFGVDRLIADPALVGATHRQAFRWAPYPTAANPDGEGHFERLIGAGGIRETLSDPDSAPKPLPVGAWTSTGDWVDRTRDIVLY